MKGDYFVFLHFYPILDVRSPNAVKLITSFALVEQKNITRRRLWGEVHGPTHTLEGLIALFVIALTASSNAVIVRGQSTL